MVAVDGYAPPSPVYQTSVLTSELYSHKKGRRRAPSRERVWACTLHLSYLSVEFEPLTWATNLVVPVGIEPTSTVLQTAALTTFAKVP